MFGIAEGFEFKEGGPEDDERDADGGGGIEAEGHRGDVGVSGAFGEAEGHPRVDEIAEHDTEGGAGEHAGIDDIRREVEAEDEDSGEDGEDGEVIEEETEEAVDISGDEPAVAGWRGGHSGFSRVRRGSCTRIVRGG